MKRQIIPYGKIQNTAELGAVVRRKRKEIRADQAKVAGLSGVGIRFLSELERGKETAELGKALQVLGRLGLEVWIVPRGGRVICDDRGTIAGPV
jgi:HTH-type transcriptional regulator/antitoxin HipB